MSFTSAKSFGKKQALPDTLYVNCYFDAVPKTKATYYVVATHLKSHRDNWTWTQNIYYLNRQLYSSCPVVMSKKGYSTHPKKHGHYVEYYPNGGIKKEINYHMGHKAGYYTEYYACGEIKMIGKVDKHHRIYVHNIYDSLGRDQLVKGCGLVVSYDSLYECISYFSIRDSLRS